VIVVEVMSDQEREEDDGGGGCIGAYQVVAMKEVGV
jgi:hypothetical protein